MRLREAPTSNDPLRDGVQRSASPPSLAQVAHPRLHVIILTSPLRSAPPQFLASSQTLQPSDPPGHSLCRKGAGLACSSACILQGFRARLVAAGNDEGGWRVGGARIGLERCRIHAGHSVLAPIRLGRCTAHASLPSSTQRLSPAHPRHPHIRPSPYCTPIPPTEKYIVPPAHLLLDVLLSAGADTQTPRPSARAASHPLTPQSPWLQHRSLHAYTTIAPSFELPRTDRTVVFDAHAAPLPIRVCVRETRNKHKSETAHRPLIAHLRTLASVRHSPTSACPHAPTRASVIYAVQDTTISPSLHVARCTAPIPVCAPASHSQVGERGGRTMRLGALSPGRTGHDRGVSALQPAPLPSLSPSVRTQCTTPHDTSAAPRTAHLSPSIAHATPRLPPKLGGITI
ncbi:hypothetical protein DFH06DRAFT_1317241 [Mycena polygramma]|nr:hypothetical protein DFH06DRAFT_1317241 [Mycena polygramma]